MYAHPRLRDDLVTSKQTAPDGTARVVLKDPVTQRFFQLGTAEHYIATQLDGATPPSEVCARATQHLGAAVDEDTLNAFVASLRGRGLLDDGHGAPVADRRHVRGDALWLRLRAFDPDRFFDRLYPHIRVFFTPAFVVIATAVILWALTTVVTRGPELASDLRGLWSVHGLVLVWVAILGVTLLHEFAHGLTCKHFGGRVHELGFLLLYFQPAFYCNVSDAWLFPEKSKRMWVMAAGGFFELFVWGIATFVWRIAEPGTGIGAMAVIVVATSGVRQFFNINPLIKFDGYYLLSDWLELPNLRQRAFDYVKRPFRRLMGLHLPDEGDVTPRERRVFAVYGLLAATFSYWLLATIALQFGNYLTSEFQAVGFLAFAGTVNVAAGNPVGRRISRVWNAVIRAARLTTLSPRMRFFLLGGAVLATLAVVRVNLTASGEVRILPESNADVRAQLDGVVRDVYVEEGTLVARGDTIGRIAAADDVMRLRMVTAEIGERTARRNLLAAGARPEEIAIARIALEKADERLKYSLPPFERMQKLAEMHGISGNSVDSARERIAVLTKERDEARARLDLLRAGSRSEEIAAVDQEIARAEAERQRLTDRLSRTLLVAPHAGVIATPKVHEKVGASVKQGDLIVKVLAVDTVRAEIAVPERDIGEVRIGASGTLRLRAYPERAFTGHVEAIAPIVEHEGRPERIVRVTIAIPNDSGLIKPDMSGYARVTAGRRTALDVMTRRFRRFIRVEFWSWW